jgi:hypothetical protein
MQKEFVPYELALRMKQLGFDEPCFGFYDDIDDHHPLSFIRIEALSEKLKSSITPAPTWHSAFKWFREIKEVEYQITYAGAKGRYNAFVEDYFYDNNGDLKEFTYEEAELACLKKLIEIVENK